MAFADEIEAFRAFGETFPNASTMLIDTFDTLQRARNALAAGVPLQAVRLDSGDLAELSKAVRTILDDAGGNDVQIVASGDLNEYKIRDLLAAGSPIDVFGVGTELVTSRDDPSLNTVYKLVEQETPKGLIGRFKLSTAKKTYPFAKQVFRTCADGRFRGDVIARATERLAGEPLLTPILKGGELLTPLPSVHECQTRFLDQRSRMPSELLSLDHATPYPVRVSDELEAESQRLALRFAKG
jgi:nicotinate phosphoribosyltransferase